MSEEILKTPELNALLKLGKVILSEQEGWPCSCKVEFNGTSIIGEGESVIDAVVQAAQNARKAGCGELMDEVEDGPKKSTLELRKVLVWQ